MLDNLSMSLVITGIGMGLVFGAIILLWAVMAITVHFTADNKLTNDSSNIKASDEIDRKIKAAVAAVSIALAHESTIEPHEFPLPPTALVSAWQAVMRSEMLKRRSHPR